MSACIDNDVAADDDADADMLSLMHGVYLRHQAAAVADRIQCVISVDHDQ